MDWRYRFQGRLWRRGLVRLMTVRAVRLAPILRLVVFLPIIAAIVFIGASSWWDSVHVPTDDDEAIPNTVCDTFSKTEIERITGRRITSHYLAHTGSVASVPDLSCTLELEGFASIRISYADDPWFWSISSVKITENDVISAPANYGSILERLELGLDGSSYFVLNPEKGFTDGYAVWFSANGRTLSIDFYERNRSQGLTNDGIKDMSASLLLYFAQSVPTRFPLPSTTIQPSPEVTTL